MCSLEQTLRRNNNTFEHLVGSLFINLYGRFPVFLKKKKSQGKDSTVCRKTFKGNRGGITIGKVFMGKITRRYKAFRWMVNALVGTQSYLPIFLKYTALPVYYNVQRCLVDFLIAIIFTVLHRPCVPGYDIYIDRLELLILERLFYARCNSNYRYASLCFALTSIIQRGMIVERSRLEIVKRSVDNKGKYEVREKCYLILIQYIQYKILLFFFFIRIVVIRSRSNVSIEF